MKKILWALAAVIIFAMCLTGCAQKKKNNDYFTNFDSQGLYRTATEKLSFEADNFDIHSYDAENDVFVTRRLTFNEYASSGKSYLFGLASATEGVYKQPIYSEIVAINGDCAIVTKPAVIADESAGGTKLVSTIGVVKFRGENAGDMTGFMTVYNNGFSQFFFAGDYIGCPGNKDFPFSTANFMTFYDYSTGRMLEVFKIRCDYSYDIAIYDNYLVATQEDKAIFFDTEDIQEEDGFLTVDERGVYFSYPLDTEGEYTEYIKLDVFYIGNGWFSRTSRLTADQYFQGCNMVYEDTDLTTGTTSTVYANIKCDFYNAKDRSSVTKAGLLVDNVANKYYKDYYAQWASYLNNSITFDEETGEYDYSLPYMDVSETLKDDYSIVYYYYYPYMDSGNLQSEITFCIMKTDSDMIFIDDMLMPTVFVDGVGLETSDPMYEQYYGSVHYFDYGLSKITQLNLESGANTYFTGAYNGTATVVGQVNYQSKKIKYGAVDLEGRIIVPFEYDELTPFYDGYALGSKAGGVKGWYRLTADGSAERILDAVNVRQGVYVFEDKKKLGLKNYAGEVILEAEYESLDVFQTFLTGGKYQSNYVVTKKGDETKIFTLS